MLMLAVACSDMAGCARIQGTRVACRSQSIFLLTESCYHLIQGLGLVVLRPTQSSNQHVGCFPPLHLVANNNRYQYGQRSRSLRGSGLPSRPLIPPFRSSFVSPSLARLGSTKCRPQTLAVVEITVKIGSYSMRI